MSDRTDRARSALKALAAGEPLHQASLTIEAMLVDGDVVVCRWHGRAIHGGALLRVPATGRRVDVAGITMFRFVGDLIAAEWTQFDGLGLIAQLRPQGSTSAAARSAKIAAAAQVSDPGAPVT